METLIITRHPEYINYLLEIGLITGDYQVIEHAEQEQITGKDVVTSGLPNHLAVLCSSVTTVPLWIPAELRGKELSIEQIREFAKNPQTFRVFNKDVFIYQLVCEYIVGTDGCYPVSNENSKLFFSEQDAKKALETEQEKQKNVDPIYRANFSIKKVKIN